MTKSKTCLWLCSAILFISSHAQIQISISDSLNAFAISLLEATSLEAGDSINVAVSPYTLWTLLTIISEGAGGNTAKQLEKSLHLPPNKEQFRNWFKNLSSSILKPTPGVELEISNAVFTTASQNLKQKFQEVSKTYYNVDITPVDFRNMRKSADLINSYISRATKNRITNFIKPDDLFDAQIFLTSTLYFKGAWAKPFNRSATRLAAFYNAKNTTKLGDVMMMSQTVSVPYAKLDYLNAHAVELPYGTDSKMSMYILLPEKKQNINTVLRTMSREPIDKIIKLLADAEEQFMDEEIDLKLPKFSVDSDFNMNIVLEKLGIKDLFDEEKADLLGIFPHYLFVSRVVQKAQVEVNEEGTVATSVSGASVNYKTRMPNFHVNRPFIYFILNKETKSIVFCGKISNPNTSGVTPKVA